MQTDRLQRVWSTDLAAFNAELRRLGLEPVTLPQQRLFVP